MDELNFLKDNKPINNYEGKELAQKMSSQINTITNTSLTQPNQTELQKQLTDLQQKLDSAETTANADLPVLRERLAAAKAELETQKTQLEALTKEKEEIETKAQQPDLKEAKAQLELELFAAKSKIQALEAEQNIKNQELQILKSQLEAGEAAEKESKKNHNDIRKDLIITIITHILNAVKDKILTNKNIGNVTVNDITQTTITALLPLIAKLNDPSSTDVPQNSQELKTQINDIIQQAFSITYLANINNPPPAPYAPQVAQPPAPMQGFPGYYPGPIGSINISLNDPQLQKALGTVANISQQRSEEAGNNPVNPSIVRSVIDVVLSILDRVKVTPQAQGGLSVPVTGGDGAAAAANADIVKKSKEMRVKIDNVKKTLKGVADTVNSLFQKFKQYQSIYHTKGNKDIYDLITTTTKTIENSEGSDSEKQTARQKILGMDKALEEARKTFKDEANKSISQRKEELKTTITIMQEISDDQPSNLTYRDRVQEFKEIIEGSYDNNAIVGINTRLDQILNEMVSELDTAYGKANAIASGIRETTKSEIERNKVNVMNPFAGIKGGGAYSDDATLVKENTIESNIKLINNAISYIQNNILKPIDLDYMRLSNPVMAATLGAEPALFSTIYQNYLDTKARVSQPVALDNLTEAVRLNKLAPGEVLQVTAMDRTVFIFVTLFIRLFAITTVESLISNNWIKKLSTTLYSYIGFYTLYMLIFVIIVNADIYRMRIVFNYVNLHANGGRVIMHLAFMWLLGFLFLIMIWHNAIPLKGVSNSPALGSETKAELMYRIEVLSMILWIFTLVLIVMF